MLRALTRIKLRACVLHGSAFFLVAVATTQAAEYVGAQACGQCHAATFQKQSASHHAHALRPIAGSPVGDVLLKATHSPDGRLHYDQSGNNILVKEDGLSEPLVLEWAFGAGAQGSTPVGKYGNQYIEHRFSYYSHPATLAPTFGHPAKASTPIAELGGLQDNRTISNCFNCHGTGLQRSGSEFNLNSLQAGVQCERCHGPGSSHIQAAERGASKEEVRKQVINPGHLTARAQIEVCGQCHRLPAPETGDEPELENPVTVRFAPIGLLASRCFRVSKMISCLTCHDPHDNARPRTDAAYTRACLGCHATDAKPIRLCKRKEQQNCLPCHMQQARLESYLRFTDHRIRVY